MKVRGKIGGDAQLELKLKTRGGARPGAGRPAKNPRRPSERHGVRAVLTRHRPVHVTLRIAERVGNMRTWKMWRAMRGAAVVAGRRASVRIVDVSIQRNHVHLICEADDRMLLARGMQGFLVAAARRVNRVIGEGGNVFVDRYHARQMSTPREVRNARVYVLNNWRHHERSGGEYVDPFSSADAFDGWLDYSADPREQTWPAADPRSWLLRVGWRLKGGGLISCWERPRS